MAIILQMPGSGLSHGLTGLTQMAGGYMAGQKARKAQELEDAKTAWYKTQAAEKQQGIDQRASYLSQKKDIFSGSGGGGSTAGQANKQGGFMGPPTLSEWGEQQSGSWQSGTFWNSKEAHAFKSAWEGGKGMPNSVINDSRVRQAIMDSEQVAQAFQVQSIQGGSGSAAIDKQDDELFVSLKEDQMRRVESIANNVLAEQFSEATVQFQRKLNLLSDGGLDAIYGDRREAILTQSQTDNTGLLNAHRQMSKLTDDLATVSEREGSMETWAAKATEWLKPGPNGEESAQFRQLSNWLTDNNSSLDQMSAQEQAKRLLGDMQADRFSSMHAIDPKSDASQKYWAEKEENWNKIQMGALGVKGVTRRDHESQAENLEKSMDATLALQDAVNRGDQSATDLISQFRWLEATLPTPPGMTEKEAARARREQAANLINQGIHSKGGAPIHLNYLYGLAGQTTAGPYNIDGVSEEHWVIPGMDKSSAVATGAKTGKTVSPSLSSTGDGVDPVADPSLRLDPNLGPVERKRLSVKKERELHAKSSEGQPSYVQAVGSAGTYKDTLAAVESKAIYDAANPREKDSGLKSGKLWNERAVPVGSTEAQIKTWLKRRTTRLEKEFQSSASRFSKTLKVHPANWGPTVDSFKTLKALPKEERMMWLLKAEESLIDSPIDQTSLLGGFKGSNTPVDVVRGLLAAGQGGVRHPLSTEIDDHDIAVLAVKLREQALGSVKK